MRLIASLAVGLLLSSACSSGAPAADSEPDGTTTSAVDGTDGTVGVAESTDPDGASTDTVEAVPPAVAVSRALEAARRAPVAEWAFTTTVDFQDSDFRQTVAARRTYDRETRRSLLDVEIDEVFGDDGDGTGLPGPFAGRATEVARIGDTVYVRGTGPVVADQDWYELGDAPLEDLLAWNYLFVDPLGERIPLLAFLDDDASIAVGTADGDGTWTYPVTFDAEEVMARLREEAPAITGWLPADLDISEIDADADGTVRIGADGRLIGMHIDLTRVVRAIADTVSADYERDFYRSAAVELDLTFDPDVTADIPLPAGPTMVPPPVRIGDEAASDLVVGDCLPAGTDLRQSVLPLVACEDAHTFEVFQVTDPWVDTDEYPGRSDVRAQADETCASAFEGYVGVAFEDSVHSVAAISPLPEGWETGDRTVVCLAESYLPRRGLLASTAE